MKLFNLKVEHLWVLIVLGACFGHVCIQPVDHLDFWRYLKGGEIMFNTHQILDKDIFTFTIFNEPSINLHWASGLYYYLIYRIGGIPLVVFMHAVLVTTSFSFILLTLVMRGAGLRLASVITFFAIIISSTNFTVKPQVFSLLFFSMTIYFLQTRKYFIIPFIVLLWTNLHAGFVIGLILVGIEWLGNLKSIKDCFRSILFYVLVISFLLTFINPWGPGFYSGVFEAESISRFGRVLEWESPSFHESTGRMFFISLILLISLQNLRKINWNKKDLLTFIIFTLFAFRSLRYVIWWAIVVTPLFVDILKGILPIQPIKPSTQNSVPIFNSFIAVLFLLYLGGCLPWLKAYNPLLPKDAYLLLNPDTPVAIGNKLNSYPEVKKIFNSYSWGDYFCYSNQGDRRIFYDSRVSIFPKKIIQDYFLISGGYYDWEKIVEKYNVDTLALSRKDAWELILLAKSSPHWKQVYEDKLGYIFLKI